MHHEPIRIVPATALAIVATGVLADIGTAQLCPSGYPQATLPIECGEGVATCFSGFLNPFDPGGGVDPDAFVVAHVDIRDPATNAPGTGVHWCAPMNHNEIPVGPDTWNEANLGQVFGIALDDDASPNVYVTATTSYGSDVASYDNVWTVPLPASPFGPGGAGAIYRLSGTTGAISVFATLPNSGPGLGNIHFDPARDLFYVTNFEDGRIYRIDSAGTCLSAWDHITDTLGSCAPEAGDAPGFAPLRERPWGVARFGDRLYYGLWLEDRGRSSATLNNQVWSVMLDGSGNFITGTSQLEITIPDITTNDYSNPVSDISFSSAGRMMLAERNMLNDVGAGARVAYSSDGHRSRNLEYELVGSTWTPSTRLFRIGTSGSGVGSNSAGGVGFDCDDNLWSTGDQLIAQGSPIQYVYGLQRTPESGNTNATIASTGYFIDLDGAGTVQSKNRIGDVAVNNFCCDCMTASVTDIECEFDATGLTNKYTVTMEITNDSNQTASYVLLPGASTTPNIIPLVPPLPSGTGEVRTVTFQICDVAPGTTHCFTVTLADDQVEECCTIEVCVDIPPCDCLEFYNVEVLCDAAGNLSLTFDVGNLTSDVIEHIFVFKPMPPDPNAGITVAPDYFDLTGSPIAPWTVGGPIGPITISGAVPGTELCLLISAHNEGLEECCAEELCFEVPDCDPTMPVGACCLTDGTCVEITKEDCVVMQGLYLGDFSDCVECDNLTPVGACCFADGTCTIVSNFECGNTGGMYLGDGTACRDCGTITPVGACCLPDGTCVNATPNGCAQEGGTYLGDGSDCDDCPPAGETGACCLPGQPCQVLSNAECLAVGGTWLGVGSNCANCPAGFSPCDFDQDGNVGFSDLNALLAAWGPCNGCPEDVTGDGNVGFADLNELLAQWGQSP